MEKFVVKESVKTSCDKYEALTDFMFDMDTAAFWKKQKNKTIISDVNIDLL